jgi:eukaryotic-like serine/threonine-protein kinase
MTPAQYEQLTDLFHASMEIAPDKRAAYLDQICDSNADLRRELESLLAAHDQGSAYAEKPPDDIAAGYLAQQGGNSTKLTSLAPNTRLDHYEIRSLLGRGGMGEVHLALDTRLNRKVAIKLLPSEFTRDPDRLRRFEQEAQAASALNHPSILTIHEITEVAGQRLIVTEYIEGETLRERLAQTPHQQMNLAEAIAFTTQVASALQAAHAAGIIHRDIKPENVMVRADGLVKVLDFGLAKLSQADEPQPSGNLTESGLVMGTMAYMSPEQTRGQKVDQRTDIFSLGAMLYEMLAGHKPFEGETSSDLIAAVLTSEPTPLDEIVPDAPAALWRIVRRCLEKRPEQRFQSAGDLGFALTSLISSSGSVREEEAAATNLRVNLSPRLLRQRLLVWILAGVLALAVIWLAVTYFKRPRVQLVTSRFAISPPAGAARISYPAISPDGRAVAFTASVEGKTRLWVRPLGALAAQPLPGTEDAGHPFWSPDNQFIGFFTQGKLKKIAVDGGSLTTLCDAKSGGGTWNRDGVILFAPYSASEIYRVSASGGSPMVVLKVDRSRQEEGINWPSFLPDGRHFLFSILSPERDKAGIYLGSLAGGETKRLVAADSGAIYAPSADGEGYLLFMRAGTLLAQGFDAASDQLRGEPLHVADGIEAFGQGKFEHGGFFSASNTGVLSYGSDDLGNQQLAWFDRTGKPLGSVGSPGSFQLPKLSRDEKQVAVARNDSQTRTFDIWLLDLVRGTESRFTTDPGDDHAVVWSPDGSRLVWASNREGIRNLYQKATNSSAPDELLLRSDQGSYPNDWSSDGQFILYVQVNPQASNDIWVLPLGGDRRPFPYLNTQFDENNARFSPDSKLIAYASNESGRWEVYVRPFPATGSKWQVSSHGGNFPRWRRDGKEMFYVAEGKMMAVEVKSIASFEAGAPRTLFDLQIIGGPDAPYAVSGDGQRFLVVSRLEEKQPRPFTVVLNWTAELKR